MFAERVYLGLEKLKELRNTEVDEDDGYLEHHGIPGQKWGVRQGPPYPLHRSSEYDTAKDIYDKLDKFDYGCIIDGKRYNETNLDEVDWSKYKTTPVDIFEKTKIGTCWDFTNYQHTKLKEAGVDHTTRMLVMDTEDGPVTHTFTTFKDSKGQNYWLEQALYSERGIRPINDYHDAVDVISKRYDSTGKRPYDVYEFNPDGMDKGLGDQEFFNRATSGDPIFQRKEVNNTNTDISTKNWMRINELYKSMPLEDRKLIDPDTPDEPRDYFKSLSSYKKTTAYNAISDNGFLVAEKIPKNQNVDDTVGVEIGIGVKTKGHGIGTKMVGDLVDWFDNQDDIDTMWWPVDERNKASIRIAEKNGFIKDPLGDNYIYAKDSAYEKLGIDNHLEHHGILGQKWGVRRYQNPDGTLTPDGRKRYAERNLKNAKIKNFESWGKDENHNVLYIIGASGSGKSTTATGLAKEHDSIIHLDTLFENEEHGLAKRNKEFERFCKDKGIDISRARNMHLSKQERWDVIDQIADQIEPYGKQCYNSGRKVVVEGVQMADDTMFPDKSYFKNKPVITLHSGKLSSAFRASVRDNKNVIDIFKDVTDRERAEWYDYVEENLKKIEEL